MTKAPPVQVRVENLQMRQPQRKDKSKRVIPIVDGVSFTLRQGEILALVGAPGCGKSSVGRALILLEQFQGGKIFLQDQDLVSWRNRWLQKTHRKMQMVFRDPYIIFSPRLTVEQMLREVLRANGIKRARQQDQKIRDLLNLVGLNLYLSVRYPWELSGANRQRLSIARALAANPITLICDRIGDLVDPSARASLADLSIHLRDTLNLTLLLISSRLAEVQLADRIAIMVQGRIVEMGYTADLVSQPLHPCTQTLVQNVDYWACLSPIPVEQIQGCRYAPVCPHTMPKCLETYPAFTSANPSHGAACHLLS